MLPPHFEAHLCRGEYLCSRYQKRRHCLRQHRRLSICKYWLSWTNTASEQKIPITILILKLHCLWRSYFALCKCKRWREWIEAEEKKTATNVTRFAISCTVIANPKVASELERNTSILLLHFLRQGPRDWAGEPD